MRTITLLILAPLLLATQEAAQTPDGRLYGHLPYPEADPKALALAPPGFALGQPCRVQPAMLPDLGRLLAGAAAAGVGQLRGLSCWRSAQHQGRVFCRSGAACGPADQRARLVGPPGHSEHATGYAIDFAAVPSPGCKWLDPCLAETPAGRWLLANAPTYGFELSFPQANVQGVSWEPWHWRWVGRTQEVAGAAQARATFARARADYPAQPGVIGYVIHVLSQPDPPTR